MADWQIGDNLYADPTGKYYSLANGAKTFSQSPYETAQDKINQMYDAQKQSQLNQLKQQREKALTGFNQQKKDLAPQYASQRNQADVVNAQNVTRLRELMAANGINMSGENITAQANMNSSRQSAFNDINNNEQQAYGAIDRQIADVNDPSKDQSIIDSIETERSSKLADEWTRSQQQTYQQMVDYRNYQEQLKAAELQRQQFEWQKQMEQQQLALSRQKAAASQRAASQKAVKPKTKDQSYRDGMSYWADKVDEVRKEGAYRVAQGLRNDPAQMRAIQEQGYDFESVIDALYNVASNGQFKNQSAYTKYVNDLNKAKITEKKQSLVDKYR